MRIYFDNQYTPCKDSEAETYARRHLLNDMSLFTSSSVVITACQVIIKENEIEGVIIVANGEEIPVNKDGTIDN